MFIFNTRSLKHRKSGNVHLIVFFPFKMLISFYRFFRLLSLDIVAGVLAGTMFASSVLKITMSPWYFFVLGSTVWIIYTIDHMLDALKMNNNKRRFFKKNKKIIYFILVLIITLNIILILNNFDLSIVFFGLILLILVLVYLFFHHGNPFANRYLFQKEITIALIYTTAIFIPPSILSAKFTINYGIIAVAYFLNVFTNVCIFSIIDFNEDLMMNKKSVVIRFGKKIALDIIFSSLILSAFLSFILFFKLKAKEVAIILLLISSVLFFISTVVRKEKYTSEIPEILADAIFIIPVFYSISVYS